MKYVLGKRNDTEDKVFAWYVAETKSILGTSYGLFTLSVVIPETVQRIRPAHCQLRSKIQHKAKSTHHWSKS